MLYLAMGFYSQSLYQELETAINSSQQSHSNLLIVTLPGLGVSYFLKSYLQKKKIKNVSYLVSDHQPLSNLNILDLDFAANPHALEIANDYFKNANIDQKFILVINRPSILDSSEYQNSYLATHLYSTFYFHARSLSDTTIFAKDINPKLNSTQINHLYQLSAGFGKIIKYLAINPNSDSIPESISKPILQIVGETNPQVLESLKVPQDWPLLKTIPTKLGLTINFDLTFSENGQLSANTLTKEEREILNFMLANNNQITREKVADFKWGIGGYDQFSDQAINKSMRRLAEKLTKFIIETIPKVGYKIIECHQ